MSDAVLRRAPRRFPVVCPAIVAAVVALASTVVAQSGRYAFTDVSDNVGMSPVINNAGSVLVRRDGNLYTGPETRKDRVLPDGHTWTLGSAMNDGGTVVYQGFNTSNVQGIFTRTARGGTGANGGPAPSPFASTAYEYLDFGALAPTISPAINTAKQVAFYARAKDGTGEGIYAGPDPATDAVAVAGAGRPFSEINPQFTAMNNGGVVAFAATLADNRKGIFTASRGGPATEIATNALHYGTFAPPQINDSGLLAFAATTPGGSERIVTAGVGLAPLTVATAGGAYADFYVAEQTNHFVDVNNAGTVVFHARLPDGGHGIFTGRDPVADKLIAVDDVLFGQRVTAVNFRPGGLNDLGQLVFSYTLADGRTGVAVATPVPEPAAVAIAAGSCLLLWRGRLRFTPASRTG